MATLKSVTVLSHEVGDMLRAELTEANRFRSMALALDILDTHDNLHHTDYVMAETLRSWIGKVQDRFQR